jgi:hypothetical protein
MRVKTNTIATADKTMAIIIAVNFNLRPIRILLHFAKHNKILWTMIFYHISLLVTIP